MFRFVACIGVALAFFVHRSAADEAVIWEPGKAASTRPAPGVSPEAIQKWRDLRFGMFIHWGPVSLKGAELSWSRGSEVPIEEYDSLYKQFNPVKFDADEWVRIAKSAGAKYIVLVAKHTDGFCLWDTKQTDFNIMHSPFGRDVVKELSQACRSQGMQFGTYYSTPDWHHPDFPLTGAGGRTQRATHNIDRYTDYLKAQSAELLQGYGPLLTLWYDMPHRFDAARGQGVIDHVRRIQPDILVNNRTGADGDYDTPERRIGGFNLDRPWETCNTLGDRWGWRPNDDIASLEECLRSLVLVWGGDGSFLLNVGPMPDGRIEPRQVDRLKQIGQWLVANGEAVYGTRGGPYKPAFDYAATRKGKSVYVFVLRWDGERVVLPPLPARVLNQALVEGGVVEVDQTSDHLTIRLPKRHQKPIVTVVKLELDVEAMGLRPIPAALTGRAAASNVRENKPEYDASRAIDQDLGTYWCVDPQVKTASLEVDLGSARTFSSVTIHEANVRSVKRIREFAVEYKSGDGWKQLFKGTLIQSDLRRVGRQIVGRFEPVTAQQIRLNVLASDAGFSIGEISVE